MVSIVPIFSEGYSRAKLFIDYFSWPCELFKNAHACALRDCLGVSRPFVSDTSPKCIDREGLKRRRTGTRQGHSNADRLWDKPNRPDVVFKKRQEKSCLFIDMAIPTEKNTSVKVTEKLSNIETLKSKLKECRGESLNNRLFAWLDHLTNFR